MADKGQESQCQYRMKENNMSHLWPIIELRLSAESSVCVFVCVHVCMRTHTKVKIHF